MIEWAKVQTALTHAGYPCGAPDGHDGPKTYTALFALAAGRQADATIATIGQSASRWLPGDAITQTPARLAEFIAQPCNETGGFTRFEEDLYYSAQGLADTWPNRYAIDPKAKKRRPNALARRLAANPQGLANNVYAGRMGNVAPGDGWAFRGRGLLQLTGRSAYALYGPKIGCDLIAKPDDAADPAISLVIAREFWRTAGVNAAVDRGDFTQARRLTNGGTIGLDNVAGIRARLLIVLVP